MACTLTQDQIDLTISFHGHWCPGLASGIRAAEWALTELCARSLEEELVAVVETDMCGVDAIQSGYLADSQQRPVTYGCALVPASCRRGSCISGRLKIASTEATLTGQPHGVHQAAIEVGSPALPGSHGLICFRPAVEW